LPEALARRSASSMASTSSVTTRDLTSVATPLCVTPSSPEWGPHR
jgi:hypothetical protein